MPLPQNQIYEDVIAENNQRDAISIPVLAAPFKTQQFTVQMFVQITTGALSDPDKVFVSGETITGGTSSATAVVLVYDADANSLIVSNVTGTFQAAEVLTGGTSGAKANASAINFPDFDLAIIKSNQELPPDPSLPLAPDNQYQAIGYTDDSDQTYYSAAGPFNPKDLTPDFQGEKTFNVETTGARWVFLQLLNYVHGSLYKSNIELFSNFV